MLSLWKDTGKFFGGVKSVRTPQCLHRITEGFGLESPRRSLFQKSNRDQSLIILSGHPNSSGGEVKEGVNKSSVPGKRRTEMSPPQGIPSGSVRRAVKV